MMLDGVLDELSISLNGDLPVRFVGLPKGLLDLGVPNRIRPHCSAKIH